MQPALLRPYTYTLQHLRGISKGIWIILCFSHVYEIQFDYLIFLFFLCLSSSQLILVMQMHAHLHACHSSDCCLLDGSLAARPSLSAICCCCQLIFDGGWRFQWIRSFITSFVQNILKVYHGRKWSGHIEQMML